MKFKITIEEYFPLKDGNKFQDHETIYTQTTDLDIDLMEIIQAFNKGNNSSKE